MASYIPAEDGNIRNLFLQCGRVGGGGVNYSGCDYVKERFGYILYCSLPSTSYETVNFEKNKYCSYSLYYINVKGGREGDRGKAV